MIQESNNTSGGVAAQTTETTTIQNKDMQTKLKNKQQEKQTDPEPSVNLKEAAKHFGAYHGTLKNWVKDKKLPASQTNPKAPYMVRLGDVEKMLRDHPNVASCFHPGAAQGNAESGHNPGTSVTADTPASPANAIAATSSNDVTSQTEVAANPGNVQSGTVPEKSAASAQPPTPDSAPQTNPGTNEGSTTTGGKRKHRRRGRGRGQPSGQSATGESIPHIKALDGSTPAERLKIMACLNELARMVASA